MRREKSLGKRRGFLHAEETGVTAIVSFANGCFVRLGRMLHDVARTGTTGNAQ